MSTETIPPAQFDPTKTVAAPPVETAPATQLERLALELLALPSATRAMLAEKLLLSLEVEEYPPQEEVARHWLEVVKQRAAELESGAVQLIPGEDVLREIREEIG